MVIIEKMSPDYIEGFHKCLDTVARERKYIAFLEAPALELTEDFILHCLRQGDPQFIALDKDRVVGWCDIIRNKKTTHLHCGTLGMGVLPAYRHQGIGTRLIMRTIVEANRLGIERIELNVYVTNIPAIELYRKVGFRAEGRHPKSAFIDGEYIDSMTMSLLSVSG